MNQGMIFTWGVELVVFWLLFLGLYASAAFDLRLGFAGLIASGLTLVAHVALSAWDPRDLANSAKGGEAQAEPDDFGVPLYYSDISNAFLALQVGLLLDASLAPADVVWFSMAQATMTYAVLLAMLIPALGLAFASAQGRTFLFLQRHALMGVWWPALIRVMACGAARDWGWALPVVLTLLLALHVARRDMLEAILGMLAVLAAGLVVTLSDQGGGGAQGGAWTPRLGLAVGAFILTGGAQVGWTVLAVMDWLKNNRAASGRRKRGGGGGDVNGGANDGTNSNAVQDDGGSNDNNMNDNNQHQDDNDDGDSADHHHAPSAPPQASVEAAAAAALASRGMAEEARDEFALVFHNMLTSPGYDSAARHRKRPGAGDGPVYMSLSDKVR